MNLLDLDDNWFLNRAFDGERRPRFLRWMLMWRALFLAGTLGSFFGALGVAIAARGEFFDSPWMIASCVLLFICGIILLIVYVGFEGFVLLLKVLERLERSHEVGRLV